MSDVRTSLTEPPAAGGGETIASALRRAASDLRAAGIDEPRREARLLLSLALATDLTSILSDPGRVLSRGDVERFWALVVRRAAHEPAARLIGRREFWSLDFVLAAETLVPRPDSETLIEAALGALPRRDAPLRLLDLGTGTGCLLLALLSELPAAQGIGVDIAPGAAAAAQANAARLGLDDRAFFVAASWGDAITGSFDVILANPPYIATAALSGLPPEVSRHDPVVALDGGADGLAAYRALAPEICRLLQPRGVAVVELGAGQVRGVAALMAESGLAVVERRRDLAGIERCLVLRRARCGGSSASG